MPACSAIGRWKRSGRAAEPAYDTFTRKVASMVYRPRTKARIAAKQKRCTKCGKLTGNRFRCKRCHQKIR